MNPSLKFHAHLIERAKNQEKDHMVRRVAKLMQEQVKAEKNLKKARDTIAGVEKAQEHKRLCDEEKTAWKTMTMTNLNCQRNENLRIRNERNNSIKQAKYDSFHRNRTSVIEQQAEF